MEKWRQQIENNRKKIVYKRLMRVKARYVIIVLPVLDAWELNVSRSQDGI